MLKRKISTYFIKRKYALLIVFTALCAGMVAGAFSVLNSVAEAEIAFNQMTQKDVIVSSFLDSLKFLGWLVLWGVNLFGFPVIIYLLYIKGATISAAICTLFASDNSSGFMLLLGVLPYIVCTVASVMILSQGSLHCSFCLFKSIWGKRGSKGISDEVLVLIAEFVPAMLIALLGGVCETLFKVNIA